MTLDDCRLWLRGTSLLELANLVDAIASELRSRQMNLQAAALRMDADNMRHFYRISVRQSWGTSVTDELPRSSGVRVGEEGGR